jgi:hypothetical protein
MSDNLVNRLRWAATLGDLTTTSARNLMEEASDRIAALEAAVTQCRTLSAMLKPQADRIAELDALLYEARHDLAAFIENAHPHREKYPHIMKDFENDMEIVRRIDAALEGGKS